MQRGAEQEFPRFPFNEWSLATPNRPAGDHGRKGGHVRLLVAAIDTAGVQFENLSRQVFIEPEDGPQSRSGWRQWMPV